MPTTEKPMSREEWKRMLSINESEKKAAFARTKMQDIKSMLERGLREIDQAIEVEYTGWMLLLKKHPTKGWECLAIVNQDSPPEHEPEWDLCLPIPDPTTIPEFSGW